MISRQSIQGKCDWPQLQNKRMMTSTESKTAQKSDSPPGSAQKQKYNLVYQTTIATEGDIDPEIELVKKRTKKPACFDKMILSTS